MKSFGVLLLGVCLLGAAGCGDDDDATSPSNLPIVLTAQLSPAAEVPPISNAESSGRGAVQITINATRDASGAITGGTADFHFQLSGFPSSTTVVGAHIHPGAAGVNGGVLVNTGLTPGTAVGVSDGAITYTATNVAVSAANLQGIVNNPAGYYFNVHSPTNPGGFARGQLQRSL